jgi:ribonuclease D
MFLNIFPSLKERHIRLDEMVEKGEFDYSPVPVCQCESYAYTLMPDVSSMNHMTEALRATLQDVCPDDKVLTLETEWLFGPQFERHRDKIYMIQIGHQRSDTAHGYLFQVRNKQTIPDRLEALLADEIIKLAGKFVTGDLNQIAKDFKCPTLESKNFKTGRLVDLAHMAANRAIVKEKTTGLHDIIFRCFHENLKKELATSNWAAATLDERQIEYATFDDTVAMEAYVYLKTLPDVTARLSQSEIVEGEEVDIAPY